MSKIKRLLCIKSSIFKNEDSNREIIYFTEGKEYVVVSNVSDILNVDLALEVVDDTGIGSHTVTSEDGWIYEHFKLIEEEY